MENEKKEKDTFLFQRSPGLGLLWVTKKEAVKPPFD
jgi:hypothetical protein